MTTVDVVVIGGGVAGSAAAARLAGGGLSALVLERESLFTDRIRGEGFGSFGFAQVTELGLAEAVLSVPAFNAANKVIPYDEVFSIEAAERAVIERAIYCVGHPDLREGLIAHAATVGVTVERGVENIAVTAGSAPLVTYRDPAGQDRTVRCRLVIGADGKDSPVRRSLGLELYATKARIVLTGLLVDDGGAWPRDVVTVGVENRWKFYIQPRGNNLVRLYLGRSIGDNQRLTGPGRITRFLETFDFACLPHCDTFRAAAPAGICAGHPMTDSWLDQPYAAGVVLVGDAAGWSDPIIGQGLNVAFRDANVLTGLLLANDRWDDTVFAAYNAERTERMRRLRFVNAFVSLFDQLDASPDERARRRDRLNQRLAAEPELGRARAALQRGPWDVPADAFEPAVLAALATA